MEDVTERIERPGLGTQGEPCPECGTVLARDQRYCLTCGARRAGVSARLAGRPERRPRVEREVATTTAPAAVADSPWRLDAGLLAGVGCLLLALLVGVLIGKSGGSSDSQRASTPQVVQLGGTAGTATTSGAGAGSASTASFASDWPEGKRGFTVQLQTLPKSGTDAAAVAAGKQAASAKGAPDVGALDSNGYGTLDPGNFVIFSGQYADRKAAAAALKRLKGKFAGAKVVEVASSAGGAAQKTSASSGGDAPTGRTKAPSAAQQAAGAKAIQDIQNSSGADYSKKSAKLPKTLVTPGAPPAIDKSKPAGGGSGAETFK
jgi:hypothetical protein